MALDLQNVLAGSGSSMVTREYMEDSIITKSYLTKFWEISSCKIEELPLHVNSEFKEIVEIRLKRGY